MVRSRASVLDLVAKALVRAGAQDVEVVTDFRTIRAASCTQLPEQLRRNTGRPRESGSALSSHDSSAFGRFSTTQVSLFRRASTDGSVRARLISTPIIPDDNCAFRGVHQHDAPVPLVLDLNVYGQIPCGRVAWSEQAGVGIGWEDMSVDLQTRVLCRRDLGLRRPPTRSAG